MASGLVVGSCGAGLPTQAGPGRLIYQPTEASLDTHQTPEWFKDAKFGIFIHWGPYSIPAFAPDGKVPGEAMGEENAFAYNPYAEWYLNSMKFENSPTARFHAETYGEDYSYDNFGAAFNASLDNWDPDEWAALFKASGARYVVLVTKHHDGFLLWASDTPNPFKENWGTDCDVVGELATAVRKAGLKFGLYYSGGFDWTFKHLDVYKSQENFAGMPGPDTGYVNYVNAHYQELIERYKPDYLWNDIGYPEDADMLQTIATYYNAVPDGLVNDRWLSPKGLLTAEPPNPPEGFTGFWLSAPLVWDARTPEYAIFDSILPYDWETTRGIGHSFGYNRVESTENLLSTDEIVRMLIQSACFNGNVLLNIGPRGDAMIDPPQAARLREVGVWLKDFAHTIQDTRPIALELVEAGGVRIGATQAADTTYIHLFSTPETSVLEIPLPEGVNPVSARLMNGTDTDQVRISGGVLSVNVEAWPSTPSQVIALQHV